MPKKTLKAAINTLANVLNRKGELLASIQTELKQLEETQQKIEEFVGSCEDAKLTEVPEIVAEKAPFVAWLATEKSIGNCIDHAMKIKSELLPSLEASIKGTSDKFKSQYEQLEGYALQHLETAGVNSIKSDSGRVESRIQTRYSVADKSLFVKAMQDLGAESELTITVRPNSKALAKIVEETGEVPAGLSLSRSKQAVFVRS